MSDHQDTKGRRFEHAPIERITQHPELLEEVVCDLCGWEPEDYAVSDESLLWDLMDRDIDRAALYTTVAERYGVTVRAGDPEPFLWDLIARIARNRRGERSTDHTRTGLMCQACRQPIADVERPGHGLVYATGV
jgi:hypothetical protein